MNKKLFAFLYLVIALSALTQAQSTIDPSISIPGAVFIQGAAGFTNVFTISDAPAEAVTAWLCSYDAEGDIIDSTAATMNGTDWIDTVQMGMLDSTAVSIEAHYYDADGNALDPSDPYEFTMNPEPACVLSGWTTISVNSINNAGIAFIEMSIRVPDSLNPINPDIIGIGGHSFGFVNNSIVLAAEYDLSTGVAMKTGTAYQYQLNAFGKPVASTALSLDGLTNIEIDIDHYLNPVINGSFSAQKDFFHYETTDVTLPLPITPASVSVGAGLGVAGGFAANCYLGIDNTTGKFGFIQKPTGERSAFSIGAKITGELHITGALFNQHLAGIRATLTAQGTIGASYEFQTVPEWSDTFLFGGTILVKGTVTLTGLVGKAKSLWCSNVPFANCEPDNTVLDGVIWPRNNNNLPMSFGDGLPTNLDTLFHTLFQNYNPYARSSGIDSNGAFPVPDATPQPAFANRGSTVVTVWMEADSVEQHLLFSTLDTVQNKFTQSIEVAANGVMMADPKVAIAPDGSSIIVWAQSNLQISDIQNNTSFGVEDLINSLEIWYAVYDPASASITTKNKIDNPVNLPASKPGIAISDSGKCLITWLAQDSGSTYTDIWYAELTNSNGIWYQSTPDIINDLPGNNYSVRVCFTDSVNAVATWITDPDGNDSTGGNEIIACYYDGTQWGPTSVISDENDNEQFHELDMDFNGRYGALAFTSSTFGDDGSQVNNIQVEFYKDGTWDANNYYVYNDSDKYVNMPRVSISDEEFAAVSYQTVDMYSDDSSAVDAGEVNLTLKDLNSSNPWQSLDFSIDIAQDTTIYVWDMDVVLGRNNTLYSLSQEEDTVNYAVQGGHYNPVVGTLFGDPALNMVLRGLKINDDLTVTTDSTSTLPETPTGIKQIVASSSQLSLLAYPNPFKNNLTIEYAVPEIGNTKLEVFDILGRSMAIPVNQVLGQGNYKTIFQPANLNAGIYILKLTTGNSTKTAKLVKQ